MREPIKFEALIGDSLHDTAERIQKEIVSIPTPFPSWNAICGEEGGREGPAASWTIVVGGADGSGKSYLAVNLAAHAVQMGKVAGFINFEMTKTGLTQRYLAILSGLEKFRLEHGKHFDIGVWLQAKAMADRIFDEEGGMLITNDSGVFNLDDIALAYERMANQGCEMICLDYAQLVQVRGQDGIFQRSEAVANKIRELTHRYSVVSVVVSQLNREGKKLGTDTKPSRHYLQGGSAWENNANQIVLIDHTKRIHDRNNNCKWTNIIVDKNRHGEEPVEIPVRWDLSNMRWEEGDIDLIGEVEVMADEIEDAPDGGHPHDRIFGEQEALF